jgi:hypothetical protein
MGFITINHHHYRRGNRKLLKDIFSLLKTIQMDQTQLAEKLDAVTGQVGKIRTEVQGLKDALAASGNATPEVEAALARLETAVQGVDDLNVDAPPAEANGEEAQG